jgi:hypothetical protein
MESEEFAALLQQRMIDFTAFASAHDGELSKGDGKLYGDHFRGQIGSVIQQQLAGIGLPPTSVGLADSSARVKELAGEAYRKSNRVAIVGWSRSSPAKDLEVEFWGDCFRLFGDGGFEAANSMNDPYTNNGVLSELLRRRVSHTYEGSKETRNRRFTHRYDLEKVDSVSVALTVECCLFEPTGVMWKYEWSTTKEGVLIPKIITDFADYMSPPTQPPAGIQINP